MLSFVNAKINLGLNIVARRPDGYHDLETVFVPVGIYSGTHADPDPFCDILEIVPAEREEFVMSGRQVNCPLEKNLVVKAARLFAGELGEAEPLPYRYVLEKHLPDGAGMGGGSADASFVLRMLNELTGSGFDNQQLEAMALRLGADCPFFVLNQSAFAQGVGERLLPLQLSLDDKWLLVVKPSLQISTKEAFAGVTPRVPESSLPELLKLPIQQWRGRVVNDFEDSLFPRYPELLAIKERLYEQGAEFALMTGSGASLYGIFPSRERALEAAKAFNEPYVRVLKL